MEKQQKKRNISSESNQKEATSDIPSLEHFTRIHKLIRKANENRAASKNKLDEQFKDYVEKNNKD